MAEIGYTLMCEQAAARQLVRDAAAAETRRLRLRGDLRPLLPVAGGAWGTPRTPGRCSAPRPRPPSAAADDLRDLPDHALPPRGRGAEGGDHRAALRGPLHPRAGRGREPQRARGRPGLAAGRTSGTRCSRGRRDHQASCSTGEYVNYRGELFDVDSAKLLDLPDQPVPDRHRRLGRPVVDARRASTADALIADRSGRRSRGAVRRRRRRGPSRSYGQLAISYDPDPRRRPGTGARPFRWFGWRLEGQRRAARRRSNFAAAAQTVRPEDVAEAIPCGADVDARGGGGAQVHRRRIHPRRPGPDRPRAPARVLRLGGEGAAARAPGALALASRWVADHHSSVGRSMPLTRS